MRKPGEDTYLYYDTTLTVLPGDVIETSTGRRYLVTVATKSNGPVHHNRWHLDVVVMHPDDVNPEGATIHMLHWYSRNKKRVA